MCTNASEMEKSDKDTLYLVLVLIILFLLDMLLVAGLLWHGKANFHALLKSLNS